MPTKKLIMLVCLVVSALLTGCSDQQIRKSSAKVPVLTDVESLKLSQQIKEDGKGVIFVYRDIPLAASGLPCIVAVDGRIVGRLSVETFLRLTLDPGKHKISLFPDVANAPFSPGHIGFKVVRSEDVDISEGQLSYVRAGIHLNYFTFTEGFDPVIEPYEVGHNAVSSYKHAQFDISNQPLDEYIQVTLPAIARDAKARREINKQKEREQRESERQARESANTLTSNSSSQSYTSLLEGLAAVFFIGLVVAAAAYGHSMPMYVPPSRPYNPPAMIQQIDTDRAGSYNLSGDRIIGGTKSEEWKIRGRKIIGSNGTEYTINSAGTRIYGNNGQSYQFSQSGRRVDGTDGSYCEYVGVNRTLKCETPR